MRVYIFCVFVFFSLFSCEDDNKIEEEISKINVNLDVERFDLAFSNTSKEDFPKLKEAYPFMFSNKYEDEFWLNRMTDTLDVLIAEKTRKAFPDFKEETVDITKMYQHLKYYFLVQPLK